MTGRWACVLGQPVAHSFSPALHNSAFAALGVEARYEAREVAGADLAAAITALREPSCLGANVTAPHKEAVIPLMDGLTDEARLLGAVNTIANRGGRLVGDNTDAEGLGTWLATVVIGDQHSPPVTGADGLVLGAGGAARAAVVALARRRASRVHVLNRTEARASALVRDLYGHLPGIDLVAGGLAGASAPTATPVAMVINATSPSVGAEVHPSWYAPGAVAVDLVYNPPDTPFLRAARALGVRAENGLGMLVHQAALASAAWLGADTLGGMTRVYAAYAAAAGTLSVAPRARGGPR